MRITCPRCNVKLNLKIQKIQKDEIRIKCPKCNASLKVKLPKRQAPLKEINKKLVLIAHGSETILQKAKNILESMGYQVLTSSEGVDAMVKIMSNMPFLVLVDVALPKIFGFEICKRLKARPETSQIKIILITSVYDKQRYVRPPENLHGADDYINEPDIETQLRDKVEAIVKSSIAPQEQPPEPPPSQPTTTTESATMQEDALEERARRLVRTILSDIMLYHKDKVKEAALKGTFKEEFASDLQEGLKLYNMRIPPEIRAKRDFFNEEIDKFIEEIKKKSN